MHRRGIRRGTLVAVGLFTILGYSRASAAPLAVDFCTRGVAVLGNYVGHGGPALQGRGGPALQGQAHVGHGGPALPGERQQAATSAASRPASRPATAATVQASQRADIFDSAADAKAQIAAALDVARRDNQRVLLLFGGNWCPWCHRLHRLFEKNKDVARMLQYEYQLVLVDVGRLNKNMDVIADYGLDLKKAGLPFLVVLGADGKPLVRQETGSLEQGQGHDPDKVLAFLAKWKAEPRDAESVLKQTLARAAAEHKAVLLHLQAPWCIWCRRLEAFMSRPEIEGLLGRDFVDLRIDTERMAHAKEVVARFCAQAKPGLPWLAILDAEGKVLVTSDAPEGNIGYPTAPAEISYFVDMLRKGASRLSAGDLQKIEDVLKEAAGKIKPAASQP